MLTNAAVFLLETFLGLFVLALLLRFLLQWFRAPPRNPLSQFLAALTDWIVLPARRFVPGIAGLDLSTLVLAWLTQLVLLASTFLLQYADVAYAGGSFFLLLALQAALRLVKLTLYIVMIVVLVQAVLTWVAPHSPAMPVLNSVSRPLLSVFQRRVPTVGNVDLSPIFVLVACQLALFLIAWIEGGLVRTLA